MACQKTKSEIFSTNASYIGYHPDLVWVTTTPAKANKVPGVLTRTVGKTWYLMYARLCTNDVITVGRVHYGKLNCRLVSRIELKNSRIGLENLCLVHLNK